MRAITKGGLELIGTPSEMAQYEKYVSVSPEYQPNNNQKSENQNTPTKEQEQQAVKDFTQWLDAMKDECKFTLNDARHEVPSTRYLHGRTMSAIIGRMKDFVVWEYGKSGHSIFKKCLPSVTPANGKSQRSNKDD